MVSATFCSRKDPRSGPAEIQATSRSERRASSRRAMDFEKVAGANGITTFRKWVLPPRRALRAPLGTQPSHLDFGNRVLSMGGSYIFEKIGNADRSSLPPVTLQKLQPKTRFGAKTLEKCVLSTTHVLELLAPEAPPKAPSRCELLKSARETE